MEIFFHSDFLIGNDYFTSFYGTITMAASHFNQRH